MIHPTVQLRRLRDDTRGNIMYLTAGLLIPILATIGAGVDLGQAYMAKSRLQQACDAGVLAGRRAMAEGTFDDESIAAANRMFNFNYPAGIYGSTGITFTPRQQGTAEVNGTAAATVQTIVMKVFGVNSIALNANCTAKLEISNADIMFVLDTTGSMTTINPGDTVSRIAALRTEVMAFFDTLAAAQEPESIVRYGVMPYSSNVNVGRLLYAANTTWLSTSMNVPSRVPNFNTIDPAETSTGPTTTWTESSGFSSWANTGTTISGKDSTTCPATARTPQYVNGTRISGPNAATPVVTPGANGSSTTANQTVSTWNATKYRYVWSSSNCREQSSTGVRREQIDSSNTNNPPYQVFRDYTYRMINYDVSNVLNGTGLSVPTGTAGASEPVTWNGCIMERDTVAFASTATSVPALAYDLDVDLIPNNEATRWHIAAPHIVHPRATAPSSSQSQTPTDLVTTSDFPDYAAGTNATGGWSACPAQAMKMTELRAADRAILQNYVNTLIAIGGTYHDVGMLWGTRFISPTGLFASENAVATNGNPISRHIIFMTDGDMAPNPGIYGFQGQEYLHRRVGSTATTELTARHNTRFQFACNAAKSRNITVWVVSFGTALNDSMRACASGDKAYQANNAAQLRTQFQSIAAQITRLRLSE